MDAAALQALARMHNVHVEEITDLITRALTDAYRGLPDADPDAVATIGADGNIEVTDVNGGTIVAPALGRVAAGVVRQAVQTWVKDLGRRRIAGPWVEREGKLVEFVVRDINTRGTIRGHVDGVTALLPEGEAIPGEDYRRGAAFKVVLLAANVDDNDAVKLTVSRRQPTLLRLLLDQHCPTVRSGNVIVHALTREPGVRAKIAISADTGPGVASVVGPGGAWMRALQADLGERVDVIEHVEDLTGLAAAALTPGKVRTAVLTDPTRRQVTVHVTADQENAVRGPENLNVRLAQKISGARITVQVEA